MTQAGLTGAEWLARTLASTGTTHVFFVDAVLRRTLIALEGLGVARVLAHSEKAASYMADACPGGGAARDLLCAIGRRGFGQGWPHLLRMQGNQPGTPAELLRFGPTDFAAIARSFRPARHPRGTPGRDRAGAARGHRSRRDRGRGCGHRHRSQGTGTLGTGGRRMTRYDLGGRTALVTGGASGIGLATASMLARHGAAVAINFLPDDPRGPEAVAKLTGQGFSAVPAPGNLGVAGQGEAMVEAAVQRLGGLDLLVNNAGTPGVRQAIEPARLDLITEELWSTVLQTNLLGLFRSSKAAAPALRAAHGAIVNIASIAGLNSAGSSLAYGASKAGVINLTKNLARALAPEVRVNAVAPGAVDSAWQIEWTEEQRRMSVDRALLKRRCTPDDIAEVVVFLGVAAAMVTGQTVVVDGGLTV
jgi:3-oxoacyl-[acyl-carrier protein] reductase